jgi:hypothetical protein
MIDGCSHEGGHSRCNTERAWVRGMPENRLALGTSAPVPDLWSCRVLRRLAEPARDAALPGDRAPDHRRLRPARGLGWCYIDEVMLDLSGRATPHNGPIPRYY